MTLTRPLVCFDLETTSAKVEDARIVQLAFVMRKPDGSTVKYSTLINPCIPIPKAATAVHGITDARVNGCRTCGRLKDDHPVDTCDTGFRPWPRFVDLAPNLHHGFSGVDFAGYNLKAFDLPVLRAEFARARWTWSYREARVLDAYKLWQILEPRTLTAAVSKFCNRAMTNAHDAMADVEASFDVVDALLGSPAFADKDFDALHKLQWPDDEHLIDADGRFAWKDGEPVLTFGKHKGTSLRAVDPGFLRWMLKQDFSAEVRAIVQDALKGKFPTRDLSTS